MEINVNELMMELRQENLAEEIKGSTNPTNDAAALITELTKEGLGFDKTKETLEASRDFELAPGGRLAQISSKYGGLVGNSCAENQGKFDLECGKAMMYLGDIVNILPVLNEAYKIVMGLVWFEDGAALLLAKSNFERVGYTGDLMDKIVGDVKGINKIVNSKHESENEKTKQLPPLDYTKKEDKDVYYKAREYDFGILCVKYLPTNSIIEDPVHGSFRFIANRGAHIITLDQYSERICGLMKKLADIEITLAACELFFAMPKAIPQSNEGIALMNSVKQLVTAIYELGKHTLEVYDNFKKGGDEVPYCFMKKIKAFEEVSGYGLQNLNKDEPIKSGLHLRENYKIMFQALVDYRKDFIRGFGLLDY